MTDASLQRFPTAANPAGRRRPRRRTPAWWAGPSTAGLAAMLLTGCGGDAGPQGPQAPIIQASLSTNRIRIGETISLTAEAVHGSDADVEWPEWGREKELVPRNERVDAAPLSGDRVRSTLEVDFTSFRVGQFEVATNPVRIVHSDGRVEDLPFPFLSYEVASAITNQTDTIETGFRPEHGLLAWPGRIPGWVATTLVAAAAAGAAAFAIWWVRRRWGEKAATPPPPRPPAHAVALEALVRLRRKGYIEQGRIEPFYVEISAIIRVYLEDRFAIHAPEQTKEEFIRATAGSSVLSGDHQALCAAFLAQCDLVKFARHEPGARDMENALDAATRLVRETRPELEEATSP